MKKVYIDFRNKRVQIDTYEKSILSYLENFYDFLTEYKNLEDKTYWKIKIVKEQPDISMKISYWGVGHFYNKGTKELILKGKNIKDLAISSRKAIREVLLINSKDEVSTMFHAAALSKGKTNIFILGERCSGKTTLALDGVLNYGFRYVSNDHLIVTSCKNSVYASCFPALISVRVSTYLDYEDKLPIPFENTCCTNIDKVRKLPVTKRYQFKDGNFLYTYRQLNQKSSLAVDLKQSNNFVILANFSNNDTDFKFDYVENIEDELFKQVRLKWMFDKMSNPRYIYSLEDKNLFVKNSFHVIEKFVMLSRVIKWNHQGRIKPLLDLIGENNGN